MQYMSASHGFSTTDGIEYDDRGKYREDKKVRKSHINAATNGLWRCPSIDINARSRDCHATNALRDISV